MTPFRLPTVAAVVATILGLFFLVFGSGMLYGEMKAPPIHTAHVVLAAAVAVFGAAIVSPDVVFDRLRRGLEIAKDAWAARNAPPPPPAAR